MLWRHWPQATFPNLSSPVVSEVAVSNTKVLELAVGLRPFIDDMRPEGLLHGAFKLADHARADVIAIDTSKAEAV